MKYPLYIFIVFLFAVHSTGVAQINTALANQLDSMVKEDQKWRNLLTEVNNKEIDTISRKKIVRYMYTTDSVNFIRLKNIFERYGCLGIKQVWAVGANNFWLLVQHADRHPDFQQQVLDKMKIEVDSGNFLASNYAYLVDRVKVNANQLQVYGTQMWLNKDSSSYEPRPVIDPDKLNERRKSVGLSTIESYIQTMNERYYGSLKKKL